jgi:hypothetical protein
MAGLDLTPIDASRRGGRTKLDDIDQTIRDTVEEAFVYCSTTPGKRLQTPAFATKDDAEDWLSEARAYAYQRPEGRVVVAGNASREPLEDGSKDKVRHVVRFRVEPFVAQADDAS